MENQTLAERRKSQLEVCSRFLAHILRGSQREHEGSGREREKKKMKSEKFVICEWHDYYGCDVPLESTSWIRVCNLNADIEFAFHIQTHTHSIACRMTEFGSPRNRIFFIFLFVYAKRSVEYNPYFVLI